LFALPGGRQFEFSSAFFVVSKIRPKPSARPLPRQPSPAAIVDQGFIPVRAKLIDLAAFLDRVERYAVADDFRCAALREAARVLVDGKPERARRILEKLSDPTIAPDEKSTGKAALGAWQPAPKFPAGGTTSASSVRAKKK
jgi:hypothetical protein